MTDPNTCPTSLTGAERARLASYTAAPASVDSDSDPAVHGKTAITSLRARVDALDAQLMRLWSERTELAGRIVESRLATGGPRRDPAREQQFLRIPGGSEGQDVIGYPVNREATDATPFSGAGCVDVSGDREVILTWIWEEVPEPDNSFAAAVCYCSGYDVYQDVLRHATWIEYLYLLFKRERPTPAQARLLQGLAIALANPGPRDHSVQAAMNGGAGGSSSASSLMAALAVGAGSLGGGREVYTAMTLWQTCGQELDLWRSRLTEPPEERVDVWLPMEHPAGFDPHGVSCPTPVRQTLAHLSDCEVGDSLSWLRRHRSTLEDIAGCPIAMTGVAAAALVDLGLDPQEGEMLFLLLRLPGAAVHALEQQVNGWRRYPIHPDGLVLRDEPVQLGSPRGRE